MLRSDPILTHLFGCAMLNFVILYMQKWDETGS